MWGSAANEQRLAVLQRHLRPDAAPDIAPQLRLAPTSAVRALPRIDAATMEHFIDDLRPLKLEVYELLARRPDLLPPVIEGLKKGGVPVSQLCKPLHLA